MSYILESYIRMYETTNDKAYLIKFIISAINIQENRQDTRGVTTEPRWSWDGSIYLDGLIIWPMAHFVYLVRVQQPDLLFSLPLPQLAGTKITDNLWGAQWDTYGDFAAWLRIRAEETLDFYSDFWADDTRCYTHDNNPNYNSKALVINMQAGFACSLFYIGIVDGNEENYLYKAARIAERYKSSVDDESLCYQDGNGDWHSDGTQNRSIMELQSNNSFIWSSWGWNVITCKDAYSSTAPNYEDISHGVQTLIFPRAINEKLESNDVMLFTDDDMQSYRNTFSFNIFDQYLLDQNSCNDPIFHNGVSGNDLITDITNGPITTENYFNDRSLAWMPFYKYDMDDGYNVYDIIMSYYACNVLNNISGTVSCGMDFYGLSEVVAAQWDKECTNLTLYNRDLAYDQDFFSKNDLIVDPSDNDPFGTGSNVQSFAEPIINTPDFIIEPDVTCNMKASNSIQLKAGFHAAAGCYFHAYIEPQCDPPSGNARYTNSNTVKADENTAETSRIKDTISETVFNVYPNPNDGNFQIDYLLPENEKGILKIYDMFGKNIMNYSLSEGKNSIHINATSLKQGIYFYRATAGSKVIAADKIVVIKQ